MSPEEILQQLHTIRDLLRFAVDNAKETLRRKEEEVEEWKIALEGVWMLMTPAQKQHVMSNNARYLLDGGKPCGVCHGEKKVWKNSERVECPHCTEKLDSCDVCGNKREIDTPPENIHDKVYYGAKMPCPRCVLNRK